MAVLASTRPVPRIGLNRIEVSLAIGVSPDSVDVMVAEGCLPRPRRWHNRKIWLVSEIEAALTDLPVDGHIAGQGVGATDDDQDWTPEL